MKLHSCCPIVYYKNKQASSLWFLKDHHCASVINNCDITLAQIQSNKRLRFSNEINYLQAYRVKQALFVEIKGYKADCFARFPANLQHMADTNNRSLGKLEYDKETGHFQATAFAPSATIHAHQFLQNFVALDAYHTKSKYLITLIIAVRIDTNNNTILLAQALVLTESEEW